MGTEYTTNYPGFEHAASKLSAFVLSMFIIALKNGGVANFVPKDVEDFRKWLLIHKVRDIKDDGTKINSKKPMG
jgi:hypothetical protein